MKPVRVLVIDDSATMRAVIIKHLQTDPRIEVVGQAVDAHSARQAIKQTNPDVITLDIEMPSMDGLQFLRKLMRLRPMPVLMISSLTKRNAETSIRAIESGAVDCIAKPTEREPYAFDNLAAKVLAASTARVRTGAPQGAGKPPHKRRPTTNPSADLVAIGASMGGIDALLEIFSRCPKDCPPSVIVQHMPEQFTRTFVKRLDRACAASVEEATPGAPIECGRIYVATDSQQHLAVTDRNGLKCNLVSGPAVNGHRPSIDILFSSVAGVVGNNALGVILTGMGHDGATGLLHMREAGARTIGQDEQSSTIYGMPRAAFELGSVGTQLPLADIPDEIFCASETSKEIRR